VSALYLIYDEAGAGSLQAVLNRKGEIVVRNIPLDPYDGENVDLAGAAIDRVTVKASKTAAGALSQVEVAVRSTEAIAPDTVANGVRLAAVDASGAVIRTATATPTLAPNDPNTSG
jgi:hypothetical protein